jgi:glycosyltransferase involved in cell wall biosynthesis
MSMRAGEKLFHSDLYTDAPRPLAFQGNFGDGGGVSVAPFVARPYDAVISVLGDSHYHSRIFDVFERFGGPCILHDARLIHTYVNRLGQAAFLRLTARLLGRTVTMEEAGSWLHQKNPASLLLELIVERASPLIVHTVTQQAQIQKRYGVRAEVIECCPTFFFDDSELTVPAKQAIRHRHGIAPATFLISSFGIVAPEKGLDTYVLATELLRSWNIPAELRFVGGAGAAKSLVDRLSAMYGIAQYVHCGSGFVDEATYRDFLIASDAGVQLRAYGFGQFSAALADCISAGLPCVANEDLAQSCDAPAYVATVADSFSPLQVAEQLALIWEARTSPTAHDDARSAYLETHNFEHYAKRLVEVLVVG